MAIIFSNTLYLIINELTILEVKPAKIILGIFLYRKSHAEKV